MVPRGIGPTSPIPGRRRATTRVPSLLQATPAQEVQTEEVTFQFSFRPCGTLATKSIRACLSDLRSAKLKGTEKIRSRKIIELGKEI